MQTLFTEHLLLRLFQLTDAPAVETLAGDAEVARTTNMPHPYPPGGARDFITAGHEAAAQGQGHPFAIVRRTDNQLVGCISLLLTAAHHRAELGYWIGRPYWGQGYATEAGTRIVRYAFEERQLNRVMAHAMHRNRASTRVMEKLGMTYEGTLRQEIYHWGAFEDIDVYGLLQRDYAARRQDQSTS
jgi:[ribosomal protein S5]-alanine N-acetyltransferase